MLLNYDLNEVLRYLGYRGKSADEKTLAMIENSYRELLKTIQPKYIFREFDFLKTDSSVVIDETEFKSKKLLSHLKNSDKIVLFGATLGSGADIAVRKFSVKNTAMGAVAQAVAASLTENLCDIGCEEISESIGGTFRPRFSPGFADLDLSSQIDFFKLLPMTKLLGVTLSQGCMMTPSKTVTAFIGVRKD